MDSLTGLRFVAAFAVVGYHLIVLHHGEYSPLAHVFGPGATGVSFFFVLSGFVLTWSHQRGDRPGAFMQRRIARIYPLHVTTWVIAAVVLALVTPVPRVLPASASLLLLAPWIPSAHYYGAMNAPSWSLGCEIFFYAAFPLLLPWLLKLRASTRRWLLLAVVAFPVLWASLVAPVYDGTVRAWAVFTFPPARLPEFVAGMLLAIAVAERPRLRLPLGPCAVVALVAYLGAAYVPYRYGLVAVTLLPFMALVVAAAQVDCSGRRSVLARRSMVRLGAWSFAVYLIHAEAIVILNQFFPRSTGALSSATFAVGVIALTMVAAALLHEYVERPLEARLRGTRKPRLDSTAILAVS